MENNGLRLGRDLFLDAGCAARGLPRGGRREVTSDFALLAVAGI